LLLDHHSDNAGGWGLHGNTITLAGKCSNYEQHSRNVEQDMYLGFVGWVGVVK